MQHGPLQSFHLFLHQGFALVKYSSREEATKVGSTLNIQTFIVRTNSFLPHRPRPPSTTVSSATPRSSPRTPTNGRPTRSFSRCRLSRAERPARGEAPPPRSSRRRPVLRPTRGAREAGRRAPLQPPVCGARALSTLPTSRGRRLPA